MEIILNLRFQKTNSFHLYISIFLQFFSLDKQKHSEYDLCSLYIISVLQSLGPSNLQSSHKLSKVEIDGKHKHGKY